MAGAAFFAAGFLVAAAFFGFLLGLALVLGVGTYLGCMATGWFNGVFAAFMATIVYVFISVFRGFKKKKPGTDLDELAEQE